MTKPNLKLIAVSTQNYLELKKLGHTADSFNDVITELLKAKGKKQVER
jgi:predicted CopG family antitoxin